MRDYLWLIVIAIISSFLYCLRLYDEHEYKSRWHLVRRILYGMGGSMLTTYVLYEVLIYAGLPNGLSIALGGAGGYIGAETFSRLFVQFLEKKIDKDEK